MQHLSDLGVGGQSVCFMPVSSIYCHTHESLPQSVSTFGICLIEVKKDVVISRSNSPYKKVFLPVHGREHLFAF